MGRMVVTCPRRPRGAYKLIFPALALAGLLVTVNLLTDDGGSSDTGDDDGLLEAQAWSPYTIVENDHNSQMTMTHDLEGPQLVVRGAGQGSVLERLLPGGGPPRSLTTLDMTQPASPSIHCLHTRSHPQYPVCPHAAEDDRYISEQLLRQGTWEPHILSLFTTALTYYPSSTVVDLGAHVGVYSLLGARMGAHVVAVEPVWASAVRLHAGALAGGVASKVTILLHASADHRFHAKLRYRAGNLGGTSVVEATPQEVDLLQRSQPHDLVTTLTLNNLEPFVNTSIILLKIDIEGWECRAVLGGNTFLTGHFAPYIFMEWAVLANNRHKYHAPCRPRHLHHMVHWLADRGYHAHISKSGARLHPAKLDTWRAGDIYWRHNSAPLLHDPQN